MSLIWLFKKFVDPASYYYEEGERQAEREMPKRSAIGDPPSFDVDVDTEAARTATEVQQYQCRICGYQSIANEYCPDCLADTMVAAAPPE